MPDNDQAWPAAREAAGPAGREPEIDGLRAVAAIAVLLFHCFFAVAMPTELSAALRRGPIGVLTNGSSAVVLFFALSGYVLAGSFLRDGSVRGATAFFVRRLFRLYPAYLAALALAWLTAWGHPHLHYGEGVGRSTRVCAAILLGPRDLAVSALVPGIAYGQLPPGWTLTIELVLSLALPLMVLLARRLHVVALVAAGAVGLLLSEVRVVQYAFPFVLGIAIRMHGGGAVARGESQSEVLRAAAFWGAVAMLAVPPLWLRPISPDLGLATASLGAAGVLVLLREAPPVAALLRSRALGRIGEVSYGLYLVHFAVLCLVVPFVLGDEPAADATTVIARWLALAALVLPVSLVLAGISYRWIEAPAIATGRRLGHRIAARP